MKTVIVGMSGGVDSSVAAYILTKNGYRVIGCTVRMTTTANVGSDAEAVCRHLGIEHIYTDFTEQFKANVIDYFTDAYQNGYTPNPCVVCNATVKWEALCCASREHRADFIATGHYARIDKHPLTDRFALKRDLQQIKDQTYALYALNQKQLAMTLFPLCDLQKDEVRKIAREVGLPVADKPDSQDICFIPDNDYARFITEHVTHNGETIRHEEGDFVDLNGHVLGRHKGIIHYTVGQRKGLGISLGKPMFVSRIDAQNNTVMLADDAELFSSEFEIQDIKYMAFSETEIASASPLSVKIRYAHKASSCTVIVPKNDRLRCTLAAPQRAITPGQAAVFYHGDFIAFGGIIV